MDLTRDTLPDDPEKLKAMIAELLSARTAFEAEVATLQAANLDKQARIDRLQLLLKTIQRATYGRSSEKLDESQYAFAFEEVQTALGEIEVQLDRLEPKNKQKPGGRRPLPAHLERVEEIIEPEETVCACGACARVKIGEDVSERLDVIAPKFRVIVTRRPRYACNACRENIVQAPASAHLIEGGIPTERLLASIAVSKYADGLPLYRQEAIYARENVDLGRNLMANWMGHIGFHLEPLAQRLFDLIREGERIFADETTLPVLSPGRGRTKQGYLWTYLRDDRSYAGTGPPIVVYRFEDSRSGGCVMRHLAGWSGLLPGDGYTAYRKLSEPDRPAGRAAAVHPPADAGNGRQHGRQAVSGADLAVGGLRPVVVAAHARTDFRSAGIDSARCSAVHSCRHAAGAAVRVWRRAAHCGARQPAPVAQRRHGDVRTAVAVRRQDLLEIDGCES